MNGETNTLKWRSESKWLCNVSFDLAPNPAIFGAFFLRLLKMKDNQRTYIRADVWQKIKSSCFCNDFSYRTTQTNWLPLKKLVAWGFVCHSSLRRSKSDPKPLVILFFCSWKCLAFLQLRWIQSFLYSCLFWLTSWALASFYPYFLIFPNNMEWLLHRSVCCRLQTLLRNCLQFLLLEFCLISMEGVLYCCFVWWELLWASLSCGKVCSRQSEHKENQSKKVLKWHNFLSFFLMQQRLPFGFFSVGF